MSLFACAMCGNQAQMSPAVTAVQMGMLALPFVVLSLAVTVIVRECRRANLGGRGR